MTGTFTTIKTKRRDGAWPDPSVGGATQSCSSAGVQHIARMARCPISFMRILLSALTQNTGRRSVFDIEGIADRLVESDPAVEVEMSDRFGVEQGHRDGDQVVAADDASFGQPFCSPYLDFRANTPDCAGDRSAGDRCEDFDCSVPSKHADWSPSRWWPQISPNDVAAGYHSGAVWAASREAAVTMAGSWGSRR
jgi:hypothetical protein